jgi:hypothetical protein
MDNVERIDAFVECRDQPWFRGSTYFAVCRSSNSIVIVKTWSQGIFSRLDLGSSPDALWQVGAEKATSIAQSLLGMSVHELLGAYPDSIKIPKENVHILRIREQPSAFSKMLEIQTDNQIYKFDLFATFDEIPRCITIFKDLIPGKVRLVVNDKEIPQ